MIEFRALGAVDLRGIDGTAVESVLAQPKRLALLAYLAAAAPSGFHRRDKLVALFWPHADISHARASLRKSIHHLRQALGPNTLVTRGADDVALNPDAVRSDVAVFRQAIAAGRYEEALAAYRGDLLDGVFVPDAPDFERWLEAERTRLRDEAARTARHLVRQYHRERNFVRAVDCARRALALEPDEPTLRLLMELLDQLGDPAGAIRAYETFVRHMSQEYAAGPGPETRALAARIRSDAAGPLRSLAVLPFATGQAELEYLADGVTDQLIADLSRLRNLRVIVRSSVMKFKNTGGQAQTAATSLRVRYLVTGSISANDDTISVTARVTDAVANQDLWSGTLQESSAAVADLPERLANRVIQALDLAGDSSARHKPIAHPIAYDCYLRARHLIWRYDAGALDRALQLLEHGIALVGENALLYAAMGTTYAMMLQAAARHDPAYFQRAVDCADKALRLDPRSPQAHILAALLCRLQGDPRKAVPHLCTALELDPNEPDALSWLIFEYALTGQPERTKPLIRTLLEIDPLGGQNHAAAAFVDLVCGRFDDAVRSYQRAWTLEPHPASRLVLGGALSRAGRIEEAAEVFDGIGAIDGPNIAVQQLARFYVAALRGIYDREQSLPVELETAAHQVDHLSWELACCYSLLGDTGRALPWLENAVRLGFLNFPFLSSIDPHLSGMRGHPQFQKLMEQVKRQWETVAN